MKKNNYKLYEKNFSEEEDGFDGDVLAYQANIKSPNVLNFLKDNVDNHEKVLEILSKHTEEILIVKNLNVSEEFRGKGFGSEILTNILNESFAKCSILVCDIGESQLPKFNLEKFYESNDYLTITSKNDYPIMIYPSDMAEKIKNELELSIYQKKIKIK
jgi:predicted GNAT family acetyltransferase